MVIVEVVPDSPAAKAGLRPTVIENGQVRLGDVITAIDGKPIRKVKDLFAILDTHKVGDRITLNVLRDGETVNLDVQLNALP